MKRTFTRDGSTWLAYLMLTFYGYFLNILGPITPFLKDELKLSYTLSSFHFTAFALGILIVGFGGHLVIQRLGRWRSLWLGAFGISLGVFLLLAGRTPFLTVGACLLMGTVGSLILAIVPSALSDLHGELRAVAISEANVVASLVAAAAPLLVGWFAGAAGGWRLALGLPAFTPLLLGLVFRKAGAPAEESGHSQSLPAQDGRLPLIYWVYWLALVLSVSVEFCMIFWSADYLEHVLGLPRASAAQAVSLFLAGMILGRLAGSRLVQRFPIRNVVAGSILIAGVGFLLYWQALSPLMGMSGLSLCGLGVAGLYPLILSLAIGSAPRAAVQAGARATLASGTAILLLPLALGRLADAVGIQPAYVLVLFLLAGAFLMIQLPAWLPGAQRRA